MSTSSSTSTRVTVAATVLFHSSCAIFVTLISKHALNGLDAPIALLALQTTVQVVLLSIVGPVLGHVRFNRPKEAWISNFPLALVRFIGIISKTLCLAAVNASIYQVARGLLLPFSLLLSRFILYPRPQNSPLALFGCAIIMCGFGTGMLMEFQALLTSTKGIALGVYSSFTTAVESVVTKRFMNKKDEGMWQLAWMSSVIQLALYLPALYLTGAFHTLSEQTPEVWQQFVKTAMTTGVAGFMLTMATFLQISVTSPTTHMIITAARGVAQSAFAVFFFKDKVTPGRLFGMACILGGTFVYGYSKNKAQKIKEAGEPSKEIGDLEMGEKENEQREHLLSDDDVREKEDQIRVI